MHNLLCMYIMILSKYVKNLRLQLYTWKKFVISFRSNKTSISNCSTFCTSRPCRFSNRPGNKAIYLYTYTVCTNTDCVSEKAYSCFFSGVLRCLRLMGKLSTSNPLNFVLISFSGASFLTKRIILHVYVVSRLSKNTFIYILEYYSITDCISVM